MSVEILTYADLGARLGISASAARSLARRLQLPRTLSEDRKALVRVDLAELRHPPGHRQAGDVARLSTAISTLQAEIAQLETTAAAHRADFEHERQRADRLMAELLLATAAAMTAREATARLEGEVTALRTAVRAGSSQENHGHSARRVGHLAASLVEADRKAASG
jgi:outer membrane murein-binding lipoprotein Lpp